MESGVVMSLLDLILSRRSIRSYEPKDVPEDVLKQILEAGRQAPSAANRQPIRFVIVKDSDAKKKSAAFLIALLRIRPLSLLDVPTKNLF